MRRLCTSLVVAAITALVPMFALAGNHEMANRIAANLKKSSELVGYKIGVRFQDGTAWLSGQVKNERQMNAALTTASRTRGVKRVRNDLTLLSPPMPSLQKAPEAVPPWPSAPLKIHRRLAAAANSQVQGTAPYRVNQAVVTRAAATEMVELQGQPQLCQELRHVKSGPKPAASGAVRPVAALQPKALPRQAMPIKRPARVAQKRQARPVPVAYLQEGEMPMTAGVQAAPMPMYASAAGGPAPARYDEPYMPNHAWPSYAAYPNYAALTYPRQYSPTAWPYIGPFYPYPQVPLGWRKVTLEWDDGWWMLDFKDTPSRCCGW